MYTRMDGRVLRTEGTIMKCIAAVDDVFLMLSNVKVVFGVRSFDFAEASHRCQYKRNADGRSIICSTLTRNGAFVLQNGSIPSQQPSTYASSSSAG